MRTVEANDPSLDVDVAAIVRVLEAHPVRLGILFGSHATGTSHPRSDVDVAIALEDLAPGDDGYNEAFFGLSADLSETLGTDDVDLVDVRTCPPPLAERIFEGVLLVGEPGHAETLRRRSRASETDTRSPRERLDASIARIDEHLS